MSPYSTYHEFGTVDTANKKSSHGTLTQHNTSKINSRVQSRRSSININVLILQAKCQTHSILFNNLGKNRSRTSQLTTTSIPACTQRLQNQLQSQARWSSINNVLVPQENTRIMNSSISFSAKPKTRRTPGNLQHWHYHHLLHCIKNKTRQQNANNSSIYLLLTISRINILTSWYTSVANIMNQVKHDYISSFGGFQ